MLALILVIISNFSVVGRYQLSSLGIVWGLYNPSERCARVLSVEVVVEIARH